MLNSRSNKTVPSLAGLGPGRAEIQDLRPGLMNLSPQRALWIVQHAEN